MIPDYSVELGFETAHRPRVIEGLAALCAPDHRAQLLARALDPSPWTLEGSLLAPSDVSVELLRDFPTLPDGAVGCGIVDLRHAPWRRSPKGNDGFSIELHPRTRRLQFIFLSSMEFRAALVGLLERHGGTSGSIVFESSFPIGFWSPQRGRHHDDRPERSSKQLFPPSELDAP